MTELILTARVKGAPEAYDPLEMNGLRAEVEWTGRTEAEAGSREAAITIAADEAFEGVIRIALPVGMAAPRFFLPGFIYGTNRGEAPLMVRSNCPRLRGETAFPASPWWMTRSDRLSHPCALAWGGGRLAGLAATPYFLRRDGAQAAWEPGAQGEFSQYAGFGCSLESGEVWYTLGYENAPWLFVDSHDARPRAPLGGNCFALAKGERVTVRLRCFDMPAEDERGLHDALKWVYGKYHELPRRRCDPLEAMRDMAGAVSRDAWLPENHNYSGFVFDRGDHYEYRPLPSITWTNGLSAAVPMLMSAHWLGDGTMRAQALDCIGHIVAHSINGRSGLPFLSEQDGAWSNRGWWYDIQRTPGHAAYLVGQAVYYVLKAYDWEARKEGVRHRDWLDFAKRVIERTERGRNADGEYPYIFSQDTGAGLEYDSLSGAWCLAAAALYCRLTGERAYLPGLLESERWYHGAFIRRQECYGGPLDIDKNIDSEGVLAYIRAARHLHEITGDEALLLRMRDALYYEFTFKFCYNSPVKVPPLSTVGWSSCGGSITSVTNPHIHPMSSSVMDEMAYYLRFRPDAYVQSRLEDTRLWSCQCHNTFDGEYGYGKKGWMSERFCHSEGLLKERWPDGSPASTWFALMPWACGSLLEGLAACVDR